MMDSQDLEKLLDRAILQPQYVGPHCPNERALADFVGGGADAERTAVMIHLAECDACRLAVESLNRARDSFAEHESRMWGAVLEDVRTEVLPPSVVIPFDDWRRGLSASVNEIVGRLIAGVAAIAGSAPAPTLAFGAGYRSRVGESLFLMRRLPGGEAVLDASQKPIRVGFDVLRAELETDGHLVVDLATADRSCWETPSCRYQVELMLVHGESCFALPRSAVHADGRATIVAALPPGPAIRRIPVVALAATLFGPISETPSDG